jgi:SAM-dependent methyltransferase
VTDARDHDLWWSALYHGGLLIAPSKLVEFFPASCPPLDDFATTRLRAQLARFAANSEHLGGLLDTVLEDLLGLDAAHWQKGSAVASEWSVKLVTGETERPRRIWAPPHKGRLPVFVCTEPVNLGVGRSRRTVARVLAWLRATHQPIALLTNGRQWRLLHAALDHESWCEWDTSLWFQEGAAGPQLTALRLLLARDSLRPGDDGELPLLAAIQATRRGQGELSAQLGERVRQAVELLIQASSGVLGGHDPRSIYIAATRLVMRCVVLLFAEARGGADRPLLPRDNPIYRASYSIQGLREQLDRAAGGRAAERLRHGQSAWPRLMSLFRLVYHGSQHERLLIPRYGGGLFFPCYDPERKQPLTDPIDRALEALENHANAPNDAVVYAILDLLTRSRVRVRQGRRSTWVMAPVDFSDLSSEYIGILYEGLLDFELRQAPKDDAMVFLNLGSQPVLPFARLDAMTEKEMVALVGKLRAAAKPDEAAEEDADEDEGEPSSEDDAELPLEDTPEVVADEPDDQRRLFGEKVQIWAEKAVKAAGIVKYRKSANPRAREAFESEARAAAKALISKIVFPDEWYLVRWGGTRKGSGTFYTRPQLAGPTTRRALQPLLYMRVSEGDQIREVIRRPEQILALRVCDPAMGSGSFIIAALRVLVDALYESLHEHGRLVDRPKETFARLADGLPLEHRSQETIPVPRDAPDFEDRLRARLKRHVVERCLYGVELDPLAVELARMAVWLETMDYQLPFEFLDHKLRCGNSLVGAWIDRVLDFPALCFERAAGDEDHDGVHVEKGARARALKQYRNDRLKPELRRTILARTRRELVEISQIPDLVATHTQALAALREIHDLPIGDVDAHEQRYHSLQGTRDVVRLRAALDRWCALWFWPSGQIEFAPDPATFLDLDTPAPVVDALRDRLRFFHWELEFPDVFSAPGAGFDAIVGNPPWETQKPNSMEFFSNKDPLYRTYDKQQALRRQRELFKTDPQVERDWLDYVGQFAALSNWFLNVAWPFGDGKFTGKGETFNLMDKPGQWRNSDKLHGDWRDLRRNRPTFADPEHPYQHQGGSDINSYKLFLEQAYRLLRPDGRLSFLVPAGIYADKASIELRKLFLAKGRWTHIYGFQNERYVFKRIHHSYKAAVLAVTKGGHMTSILTRFRIGPGDSPEAHEIETGAALFGRRQEKVMERLAGQVCGVRVRDRRLAGWCR